MMLALLGLAWAGDSALEARLLGPEPVAAGLSEPVVSAGPSWTALAGFLGLGLVLVGVQKPLRRALGSEPTEDALTVVSRTALGQGGLALVDVQDSTGEVRRLLVGTGSAGPRLLADLSTDFADLLPEEETS